MMDVSGLQVKQAGGLRYSLSVPPRSAARPPVIVFLHGYDEGPPTGLREGVTRHGPLRPGNPPDVRNGFLVAAPQLPTRGDLWDRNGDAVRAIVEEVIRGDGGDPARVYLTGFSFGGNGVFALALQTPHAWAALWAVDPTRVPQSRMPRPIWLSFGEVARREQAGFIHALGLRPADEHPEGDALYVDEGADHVGSATLAYADERIYGWLRSKSLTPHP